MRVMTAGYHKIPRIDTLCWGHGIRRSLVLEKVSEILFFPSAGFLAYDTVPEAFMYPVNRKILLGTIVFAWLFHPLSPTLFLRQDRLYQAKGHVFTRGAGGCAEESAGRG